jgi:mRNA-degrading endonuclease RelE of RelBE toxin-antitoxin system
MKKTFTLHIPKDVQGQLRRCRTSIRESIRKRLQEIVESLAIRPTLPGKAPALGGPGLRFYVYEGYRVSYQVDPLTRRLVVLKLGTEAA